MAKTKNQRSESESDKKKNKELNFESLANRFRPKTLDDLVGQDAIVAQIRGMFATGRVPPVFMITGDSGVGKTTTSRMIARYLNCSNRDPKTHDPCGECDNCKYDINHPDFLELNAADSRGIDDMRNLIQSAKNMPSVGKYRIILLDECFPAGTLVRMSDGSYVPIENGSMLVGQKVETRNEHTGEIESCLVTAWGEKEATALFAIYLTDGSVFRCTENHPIWSETRKKMVRADHIQQGEAVYTHPIHNKSSLVCVSSVGREPHVDGSPVKVYDITVERNHNFFVRAGDYTDVLVSNCHRITDAAAPILLKPLEDPPRRTVWILATTNPEKLPSTILGRCHPLTLKPIEQEVIVKRLNKIARKMGTDFKEMDDGMKVLKTIANFSEGRMRNAIQMLDIALLAIASGEAVDTKSLIARYVTTEEAQLEKQSVGMVVSVLAGDLKSLTRSIRKGGAQPRGLMYKARFLIQYLLDEYAGVAKYVPYSGRLFAEAAKASSVKPNPIKLMQLQYRLIEIEQRMNTMSLDESIQLLASLGALIREEK